MTDTIQTTKLDAVDAALIERLHAEGEHLAAGFLELGGASPLRRMSRAIRRQLEHAALPNWQGETLYPAGQFSWYGPDSSGRVPAISFSYSHSLVVQRDLLQKRATQGEPASRATNAALLDLLGDYPQVGDPIDPDICLGGRNYTHSILNYGRIIREGWQGYAERISAGLARAKERAAHERAAHERAAKERVEFYTALDDLLAGLRAAHARALDALKRAQPADAQAQDAWARLVKALEWVPWHPARNFYEGLVALNFCCYLDGVDSLGRFDQDLGPLYEADLAAGRITHDEGVALVGQLWANVDANSGWNVAIGGTAPDGSSASNRLTLACLEAMRGRRRPNLALRIARETPPEFIEAALDAIATGCGQPALYNEELYLDSIQQAHLNVAPQDMTRFAFGGCTELMVHGCSNVGSLDGGLNLPLILSHTLQNHLPTASDFPALFEHFARDLRANVERLARQVSQAQELHARYQPQPIRTLFIDDCVDAGVEYNAGGARYNWSVINIGGLGNVADSLAAVREAVFERGDVDAGTLAAALATNFQETEPLRQRLMGCPRYGNDDPRVDELASQIAKIVFTELRRYAPWRGGRFIPGCLMFVTYADAGRPVGATPDGRLAGEPIADSIGAVQGRDRHGPTALIRSVASIPQHLAPGTLVTNFRFARS
ncbi:MAG: hypothetical protein GX552_06290, partial [Chloroflexi bacterium]|nr:hypothetical protein [Chloroflexota bacterium]